MNEHKWRFPPSGHGERKGISSGDSEAFKGTPYKAFAREILQNSIDARASDEEPTVVEFNVFEMSTNTIPGYEELKNSIRRCKELWAHKPEYVTEYQTMLEIMDLDKITCLRVSDFNTTGLVGVDTINPAGNKFLALTKGTGVSEKSGSVAAGSKGVGKNAAFLMSSIKTVFYSTRANQNILNKTGDYVGSIGVAELVSGYVDDVVVDKRDYTQGTGYFSSDDYKNAIQALCNLDPLYQKREGEFGTDIYILGFLNSEEWEKEVINSILDSFMASIVRGELEVYFNDREISKNTIGDIVYDKNLIFKNNKSNLISQYRLLTDGDNVSVYDIETDYGTCQLLILPFSKEEEELATHKCVMIRHPLMKIKELSLGSSFRVSAMCIINDDKLGKVLRDIENPQHIDWEPKRIKDKSIQREVESVLQSIRNQIRERVIECLQIGDENPIDPSGAGDFLPDLDFDEPEQGNSGSKKPAENVSLSGPKTNQTIDPKADKPDDKGLGLTPDIGAVDDEVDGGIQHPSGENDGNSDNRHPGQETGGQKEGEDIIFRHAKLSGVKYRVISLDKQNGKIRVVFTSPVDNDSCYLSLVLLDDSNSQTPVQILNVFYDGDFIKSDDNFVYGPFSIVTNKKVILDVETNIKGYFACGVKVLCK